MALKYESEITRLACNLTGFTERNGRNAYCWAFDPITHDKNFIPRAIAVKKDECGSWALSFFDTEQSAKKKLKRLMRKTPNIYMLLGTHIAEGSLFKENGISEDCNSEGHFNHHEYANNDFKETFTITVLSYI